MSNFSDSSQAGTSSEMDLDAKSSQLALEAGLAALKQKEYLTAIAQLEAVCQSATNPSVCLKAQMGLVRAYTRINALEPAIALCKILSTSTKLQVRTWASQTLEELSRRQPPSGSVAEVAADQTGFVPLTQSLPTQRQPAETKSEAETQATSKDQTGFIALEELVSDIQDGEQPSQQADRRDIKLGTQNRSSAQAKTAASPTPDQLATESATDSTTSATELQADAALTETAPEETSESAIQLNKPRSPLWRQAGRAQRWASLGAVDPYSLWALEVGTVIALFWLLRLLVQCAQTSWNRVMIFVKWPVQLWVFTNYHDLTGFVIVVLVFLACASPWLLDLLLDRVYHLKPLGLPRLEASSPETVRLLKRVFGQRRQPIPTLSILPTAAPLAFVYGHLPRTARIVVSQGLLEQLSDDEIAAICAAELGHIAHWDFGVMSWVTLVAQLPYLLYWHVAAWGDRQSDRVLQSVAVAVSSLAYGLYWLCRLPGLWLSRVRLYYGDRTATDLTGNPNGLVRALLKVTMGTAAAIQRQSYTSPLLESFDLLTPVGYRSALSLGSTYAQAHSSDLLEWDRSNPYRHWLAINNAHPPLGGRLNLLTLYARHWHLETELDWQRQEPGIRRQGNLRSTPFTRRTLLQGAPFWGLPIGLAVAICLWIIGWIAGRFGWLELSWLWGDRSIVMGCCLIGFGLGMILRINPSFPDINRSNLQIDPSLPDLLTNPAALPIDSQPVQLRGKLIGRRGFSNRMHQDLMLHTQTGVIRLHYTSKLGWLGNLLSQSLRPTALMGAVTVTGWFRRGATPWVEVETIQAKQGTTIRSQHPVWSTLVAVLAALLGAYLIYQGGS